MLKYYEQRRPEYEGIYTKPERQDDLAWLERQLLSLVNGKRVYELACGTGYWTRRMAQLADSIHATDGSSQLALAALSSCEVGDVTSASVDAFDIPESPGYNCVIVGFFFSHILIGQRDQFITGLAKAFDSCTRVVLFDNNYVEGSNIPISRRSEAGDTYQARALSDGTTHEVLKNFPDAVELDQLLSLVCDDVEVSAGDYFWFATGILR